MQNLLKETLECLEQSGKSPKDVLWVSSKSGVGSWDDFAAIADFEYDNGYGANEIDSSAKIVGDGWWLDRGEHDGSEWWNFNSPPQKPKKSRPLFLEDLMEV